ncbi:Acyl carrier protein [Duganella sp. CF517]|uniref:acyl carrier protein n=1 Tax=Duganella sp. CF517 TaxID=1881038 RepID=UPI0008C92F19|nr:acyl carrier protein [Duganella sp. CF517]SEN80446.1 Acyl carrier protein [Duganella sp. CF517]
MSTTETVCDVLRTTLGLGRAPLDADTALLGSLPELDSMAVVALLLALEQRFGIAVDDDEISARHFASVGTLSAFVQAKLGRGPELHA